MPVPYPDPVQFDQQKARDAVAALNAAIALLRDRMATDGANAQRALTGWTGHHADSFSTMDLPWIGRESARILDGMVKLASAIGAAEGQAVELQRQHDLANRRWLDRQADTAGQGRPVRGPF
ncbi:MAG TPA: hypothetical protein VGO86_11010 [Candidatus Dormibacteraeota bacterium]